MKVMAYRHGFWLILGYTVGFALFDACFIINYSIPALMIVELQVILVLMILFMFTLGRSFMCVLTIGAEGVTGKAFWMTLGTIRWEEMGEVGIGAQHEAKKHHYFLYFSKVPLKNVHRNSIRRLKQNQQCLYVECSKNVLEEVRRHYRGRIVHLSELERAQVA